jgi:hypothetical protein
VERNHFSEIVCELLIFGKLYNGRCPEASNPEYNFNVLYVDDGW